MKLAILGATGMVGSRLVDEAVRRGHRVVAVARRPAGHPDPRVSALALDLGQPSLLLPALEDVDAALLAVRLPPGQEQHLGPLTVGVLEAAAQVGTPVLVIGGAGPLRSPDDPSTLVADNRAYVPPEWQDIARASVEQLRVCLAHSQRVEGPRSVTYLSPPADFRPGVRTGRYRRGSTTLLVDRNGRSRLSVEDAAVAALDEVEQPGRDAHFTVAEAA